MGAVWSSDRTTVRPLPRRKVSIGMCIPKLALVPRRVVRDRAYRPRPLAFRTVLLLIPLEHECNRGLDGFAQRVFPAFQRAGGDRARRCWRFVRLETVSPRDDAEPQHVERGADPKDVSARRLLNWAGQARSR